MCDLLSHLWLLSSLFYIMNNILAMCVLKFAGVAYDYCTENLAVLCQGKPGNRPSASQVRDRLKRQGRGERGERGKVLSESRLVEPPLKIWHLHAIFSFHL